MLCGYVRTTTFRIRHQVSYSDTQRSQLLLKSPTDLCRGLSSSKIWLSCESNLTASWTHLHHCRRFPEHLGVLLQSPIAHCVAPGGSGNIWKYLEAQVRLPGVSGMTAGWFQTDSDFADVIIILRWTSNCSQAPPVASSDTPCADG